MTKALGDFLGKFIEYDFKTSMENDFDFSRIKVMLDIRKPLKRKRKLVGPSGEVSYVRFQYEKVFTICFIYGRLGHTESFCDI